MLDTVEPVFTVHQKKNDAIQSLSLSDLGWCSVETICNNTFSDFSLHTSSSHLYSLGPPGISLWRSCGSLLLVFVHLLNIVSPSCSYWSLLTLYRKKKEEKTETVLLYINTIREMDGGLARRTSNILQVFAWHDEWWILTIYASINAHNLLFLGTFLHILHWLHWFDATRPPHIGWMAKTQTPPTGGRPI